MIYSNYDRMNIENAFDRYLAQGVDDDYYDRYDDETWYDDGYGFEEVD